MKTLTLILAFLPLIVFSVLARFLPHGYIGVSRVGAAAINGHTTRRLPELLIGLALPTVIALYMLKFSKDYPARVTRTEPARAHAGS